MTKHTRHPVELANLLLEKRSLAELVRGTIHGANLARVSCAEIISKAEQELERTEAEIDALDTEYQRALVNARFGGQDDNA